MYCLYSYIASYIYIYICVCVRVCVCTKVAWGTKDRLELYIEECMVKKTVLNNSLPCMHAVNEANI